MNGIVVPAGSAVEVAARSPTVSSEVLAAASDRLLFTVTRSVAAVPPVVLMSRANVPAAAMLSGPVEKEPMVLPAEPAAIVPVMLVVAAAGIAPGLLPRSVAP